MEGINKTPLTELQELVNNLTQRVSTLEMTSFPVGTITQSFLTEEKFQGSIGPGWVLCDGRSVDGSKFHQFWFGQKIPDCRGRFLRTAGGKASEIGQVQEQKTAVNGLKAVEKKIDAETLKKLTHFETNTTSISTVRAGYESGYFREEACDGFSVGFAKPDYTTSEHQHEIDLKKNIIDFVKSPHNFEGDIETRPDNITVNTFIRIN